jgi:catechol 2,3-dioxygenase-like lactoylglutathione lyase family enzyme
VNARLTAIFAFRLTTQNPERLARFYRDLGFSCDQAPAPIPAEEIALLGLRAGGRRIALRLGQQRLDLDTFDEPGQPYPSDSSSADLWFQHFALVTNEAAAQWARAKAWGAQAISSHGAVTLPPSSGGVTAVKFRDPDGHPLEFLQFPTGADHHRMRAGILGIDHSAISVKDARASQAFYEMLGLSAHNPTCNQGSSQDLLDGLSDVEVDVIPMAPQEQSVHLELLGYLNPRGRGCPPVEANDVAATRVVWAADRNALLRDPDGHLHELRQERGGIA